jgi:hypothetical protein
MRTILSATVMVAIFLGAVPAAMALDDPTIACNETSDPWGSQELCYTGPRTPSAARAQSHTDQSTTAAAANARALPHRRPVKRHY